MSNEELNPASCQTAFSIHDLKCGNILNYDTAEGEVLPTVIDWQDLKWLTEDPKGFNLVHSPIKLTDDVLVKMGFSIQKGDWCVATHKVNTDFVMNDKLDGNWRFTPIWCQDYNPIVYVHELQNLYFCLFGEELSLKVLREGINN